jgi:capsular exopolysaccharide synthesis family protein
VHRVNASLLISGWTLLSCARLNVVKGEAVSQIFDALQRSESERSGSAQASLSRATEILRKVEKDETTKWEMADVALDPDSVNAGMQESSVEGLDLPPSLSVETDSVSARPAEPVASTEVLDDFQTLDLSLSPETRLVSLTDLESPASEAFRLLSVRLRTLRRSRPFNKLLITSTIPQEGKSTVSANLACTLARSSQQKVLLLDGDLRRPSLSNIFGVGRRPGLCECLRGECNLTACVYQLKSAGLWLLPAGDAQGKPLEHLQSGRLPNLIVKLNSRFDWIIIDSPPVLPLADTSIWSRMAEGILLVARQGTTERKQLKRGLESLERQKVIGAILNSSKYLPHSDYYYRSSSTAH